MEEQSKTLGGQLSNLEDSLDKTKLIVYELAGAPVKDLVSGATALINTFINLPAPIQATILGFTGLTAVLASAVTVYTAFEVLQVRSRVVMLAGTAVTTAQTLATGALSVATGVLNLELSVANARFLAVTVSEGAYAIATGAATAATSAFAASLAVVAASLGVVAAGIAAISFVRYTKDLEETNKAIEEYATQSNNSTDAALKTATALDNLNDIREKGGKLTAEQIEQEKQLKIAAAGQLAGLKAGLEAANQIVTVNDEQKASKAAIIAQYTIAIKALETETGAQKKATDATKKATDALEESTTAYQKSTSAIAQAAEEKRAALLESLLAQGKDAEAGAKELAAIEKKSIEDRINAAQEQLVKLSFLKIGEKDPAKLEKINAEILKLESEVTRGRISLAQTELNERKRIEDERLAKILEGATKAKDLVVKGAEQQRVALLESLVSQGKDLQSAQDGLAAIEQKGLRDRISANNNSIAKLNKAKAGLSPEDLKKINDQIESLEADSLSARSQLANNALNESKRIEDEKKQATEKRVAKQNELEQKALEKVRSHQSLALEAVKNAENGRLIAIQTALNKGLISEEQASAQRLDSKRKELNDELLATAQQIAKLEALPKFSDPEKEKQRQSEIRAARAATSGLTLQLLENERSKQEQYKNDLIKNIERVAAADKNRSDRAIANLDKEKAAQDLILATLERQNKLTDSRLGVVKAQNNLEQVQSQNNINALSRAQEIRKQLDDGSITDAQRRTALEKELRSLVGNSAISQLDLIKRRQAAEDQLATHGAQARANEQAGQRAALESEIIRNKILSDRAVLESKIAEIRAKQQLADAEVELQKAQIDGDKQKIANAQKLVDLAKQGVDLAAQNVDLSTKQLGDQAELAANSKQQLSLEQQAANTSAIASNRTRENAQTEELIKAGGIASNNKFVDVSAISPTIPARNVPLIPAQSPITPAAMQESAKVLPEFKGDVKEILAQLRTLNTGIIMLAKTPRSLSLSSPEPVQDLTQVLSDLSRMNMQSAGL